MTSHSPLVTIVIPVYNEGAIIEQSIAIIQSRLRELRFSYAYEICMVDNASTDDTWSRIEQLKKAYPEVAGLSLAGKGKGRAIRAGWAQAKGDILVFMDIDLSSDLASLQALIDAVVSNSADLSIGNRLGKRSKIVTDKQFRKIASRVYNGMARLFLKTQIDDHQCGFKAISRSAYTTLAPELTEDGFFFDTELLALARRHALRIHQEDIVWTDSPTSKVSLISDSAKMFVSIVKLAWRLRT